VVTVIETDGSRLVPGYLSGVIRAMFNHCDLPYRSRTFAEYVFGKVYAVPLVQYAAIDHLHDTGELPSIEEARDMLLDVVADQLDQLSAEAVDQYKQFPDHVSIRATKLVYDAYAELDAASQVAELTAAALMLNTTNDVRRKVDAVFYPPRSWRSSWPRVLLGFKRSARVGWRWHEERRDNRSEAHFQFHCPQARWEMVGAIACFPSDLVAEQLGQLRAEVTQLPRAR
jgi:hypothetical protein